MKRIFNGVEFISCTAIASLYPEDGRQPGVYVHDLSDRFRDGDGVIFNGCTVPESEEEAAAMLQNEDIDTAAYDVEFED